MLARLKKKQEAATKRAREHEEADEAKLQQQQTASGAPSSRVGGSGVAAFAAEPTGPSAADRYAQLAAQMESARSSVHRNYAAVPEDEVTKALRASAAQSARSMATGLTGNEGSGGLHVRDGSAAVPSQRSSAGFASASRAMVGPSAPAAESSALQAVQAAESVEWTPPVQSDSGKAAQDRLRAKFAGRY
jgi:hypothetical protein